MFRDITQHMKILSHKSVICAEDESVRILNLKYSLSKGYFLLE
jgi:hypothetical protein